MKKGGQVGADLHGQVEWEKGGQVGGIIQLDTTEDFLGYMNETYPKALDKLKELCEK